MMGFANSPVTRDVLASHGIRVDGYRWRWRIGLKGGTFPPHFHQNGDFATDSGDFDALPGDDVNGANCTCQLVPQYRDAAGRFAKPGLQPVFQAPATASLGELVPNLPPIDWTPLMAAVEALTQDRPLTMVVPEGAFTVNVQVPDQPQPYVDVRPEFHVSAPIVKNEAPVVNLPELAVTVQAAEAQTVVNVEAPNVTVPVTVKPAPVKIIREKINRVVNFRRNAQGLIEEASVEE